MKFKEPKTIEEQIEYLKTDKRVVFNDISEIEAKEILVKYGYINVISPFKYFFAEKDKRGEVIKCEGRHVYTRDIDFKEYYNRYQFERRKYSAIFKNISNFENIFNSIISYECIHFYKLDTDLKFDFFISSLVSNIANLNLKPKTQEHHSNTFSNLSNKLSEFNSIYILFDRLTLNETFAIFQCCDATLKSAIFNKLKEKNCTFNETRITNFERKFSKLVQIRNYVYHNNSLTILVRYSRVGDKKLRGITDRKEFRKLIYLLSNES